MKTWFFIFFILPLLGLAYVAWHLWHILPWNPIGKMAAITTMVLATGCMVFNFTVGLDELPMWLARFIYETGTSSLIALLYTVMLFILLDIGRMCHIVPGSFLHSSVSGSILTTTIIVILLICGNINYHHKQRKEIELRAESPLTHPVKIVLLSDMHLGYHNTRNDLARWVDIINSEQPDIILIAGDIIDHSTRPLYAENMAKEFHRLRAPVYACPGNHEYISGIESSERFFKLAGITLLRDTSVVVANEITITGRDDRHNTNRMSIARLSAQAPKTKYTIVLDHQPYHLERSAKAGTDFQFSGHTHYGQVWPINMIEDVIYENAYGLLNKNNTTFYVSSGIGIWGGKYRIGTCSEYVVATIR